MGNKKLRNSLSMSQQDFALLLGISRGYLSMYETGRRQLPTQAILIIAELEQFIHRHDTAAKRPAVRKPSVERAQQQIQSRLREVEYQELRTSRKLAALAEKQAKQEGAVMVVNFIASQKVAQRGAPILAQVLHRNASKPQLLFLMEQQRQQQLLAYEKKLLQRDLKKVAGMFNAP